MEKQNLTRWKLGLVIFLIFLGGSRPLLAQYDACKCLEGETIVLYNNWHVLNQPEKPFFSTLPEVSSIAEINQLSWESLPSRKIFRRKSAPYWVTHQNHYWMRHPIPDLPQGTLAMTFYNLDPIQSIYWGSQKLWTRPSESLNRPIWIHIPASSGNPAKYLYVHYRISNAFTARQLPQSVAIGTPESILERLLTRGSLQFLIALITIGSGVALFLFFLMNPQQTVLFHLFVFSTAFGLSELASYSVFAFWFPLVSLYLRVFFFIFPIGVINFFRTIYPIRHPKVFDFLVLVHMVYSLIGLALILYDHSWASPLRDIMYILLGVDVLFFVIFIFPLLIQDKQNTKLTLAGFLSIPLLGSVQISNEVLDFSRFPFFSVAMLFFLSTLLLMIYRRFQTSRALVVEYTQELETKNEELSQLDRLKDEFLANTSHELRTPLHGIIGIADSLNEQATLSPDVLQERIDIIIQSARRLNHLINDILDSASLKAQKLQLKTTPIALSSTVTTVFGIVGAIAQQKSIQLVHQVLPSFPFVQADEERLQQILLNLLGNALKFTEHGQVEVSSQVKEGFAEIAVSDTGSGIDLQEHEKIFQAFEMGNTAKMGLTEGTGLGLSITKDLVQLHGGQIWLDHDYHPGTRFIFTLPLSQVQKSQKEGTPAPFRQLEQAVSIPLNSLADSQNLPKETTSSDLPTLHHILVVDDDSINLQILKNQLASKGFHLQFATSAREALQKIEAKRPDLILLDVMMPEMDGFTLCQQLRQNESLIDLPIIFLTAKTQIHDIVQGFSCGGNDYLPKPFSKEELLARIKTQLHLLTAKDRLVSLRDFSNQIGKFHDTEKLVEAAFEVMRDTLKAEKAGLFQGEKLVKGMLHDSLKTLSHEETRGLLSQDSNHLKTSLTTPDDYTFVLQRNHAFSAVDQEYMQNIIEQVRITQENLYALVADPKKLEILSFIANHLEEIVYIQSERNYCTIVIENQKGVPDLHRISLKSIKLYFADHHLLQIHRSYLINPHKVWRFEAKRNKTQLLFDNIALPVGKFYLDALDKTFPHLQTLSR